MLSSFLFPLVAVGQLEAMSPTYTNGCQLYILSISNRNQFTGLSLKKRGALVQPNAPTSWRGGSLGLEEDLTNSGLPFSSANSVRSTSATWHLS